MEASERQRIIRLVRSQVAPAVGCTEPVAVALCVARATQLLGRRPDRVSVRLSANILKNAMGVGIPGTGMIGLPIAVALGALIGRPENELEVLRDVTPDAVAAGKQYIDEGRISIKLAPDCPSRLYIEVEATADRPQPAPTDQSSCATEGPSAAPEADTAIAVIAGRHTRFVRLERNGVSQLAPDDTDVDDNGDGRADDTWLNLRKVYDFATTAPLEEIDFINEASRLNCHAAEEALKGRYGHELGKTLTRPLGRGIMGESIFSHIISATACACDARMAGATIPVMSNSGSGNQGICATIPVAVFGRENHNTEEEITRALMLSHLTAIYFKQSLGTLSALCGCVVASTGSSVGITYLMGGDFEQVSASVKNMVANLTGMICDGAKPSCSLKLASGVSTAVLSSLLAMQQHCVTSVEGIIDDDVDRSIHNLTRIGHDSMCETDRCVLDIMTSK
jgi:L-cysteine desulfidase